jgi:small subunit ribosomal protein S1
VEHPSEALAVGDELSVKILAIDSDKKELRLSARETQPHPFDAFAARHAVGDVVEGTVRNLIKHGAFVEVAEGVDGLVHVSELSHLRVDRPSDVVTVGEVVRVKIKEIKAKERKLGLSMKQLQPHPFDAFATTPPGTVMNGTVRSIKDFGAFVAIRDGVEGLVHISEMAYHRVGHPSEIVRIGQQVRVRLLSVDRSKKQVKLSLKAVDDAAAAPPRPPMPTSAPIRPSPAPRPAHKRTAEGTGQDLTAATAAAAHTLGLPPRGVVVLDKRDAAKSIFGKVKQPAWVRVRER